MLNELIQAASTPRIAPTNYSPLVSMIKRLLNDNNFNVVVAATKIVGLLAKGLRKNFTGAAKNLVPMILSKFKDKKTILLDETHCCMESFFYCF